MKDHVNPQVCKRCQWAEGDNELMIAYHDTEWGIPVHDDKKHFEFLILEGAQAGLSWNTILKRREGYRQAFADFNPEIVATYDEKKITELLASPEIIRNRLKIVSCVINAKLFLEIKKEFGSFDRYLWSFVKGKIIVNNWATYKEVPVSSKESIEISKDLKKRGFKFVGPTIIYAYMQAVGLVNDHTTECFCRSQQ